MSRRFGSSRVFATLVVSSTALACADTGDEPARDGLGGGDTASEDTASETGHSSSASSNGTSSMNTASSSHDVNPTGNTSSSSQAPTVDPAVAPSTVDPATADSSSAGMTSSADETTGSGTDETHTMTGDPDGGGSLDTMPDAGTSGDDVTSGDVTSDDMTSDDGTTAEEPACPSAPALTGGQQYCSNQRGNAGNGYGYELWAEGSGSGCMTVFGSGAAFAASWSDVEDFLARVGLDFDETRTHQQIGNIWAEFSATQTGSEEGLTYIGMYGWTVDPLREFYILDDWGATKPGGLASDGSPRDEVGTLEIDGETYDVWKKTREEKPSIQGTATFDQYFSIRRTARSCGRISVSEHFSGWEDLGLPFGKLYEVKLLVESQFNTGSVEFTSAEVRVD